MKFDDRVLGFTLTALGVALLIIVAWLAYVAYSTYTPILPRARALDEAITNTVYELLNLVLKLGFLGVLLGCSSVALKHGISMLVELRKIEKSVITCSQH